MPFSETPIELQPRDANFWGKLFDFVGERIAGESRALEALARWDGPSPWISFQADWNPDVMRASVRRNGDAVVVSASLGLILLFDDVATWANQDVPCRNRLNITRRYPTSDVSDFMHTLWMLWVLSHELSHFLCGHLNHSSLRQWDEWGKREERNDFSRAREIDADRQAAWLFARHLHHCVNKGVFEPHYGPDAHAAIYWDVGFLFALMMMQLDSVFSTEGSTHPPIPVRTTTFITMIAGTLNRIDPERAPILVHSMNSGLSMGLVQVHSAGKKLVDAMQGSGDEIGRARDLLRKANPPLVRLVPMQDDWLP